MPTVRLCGHGQSVFLDPLRLAEQERFERLPLHLFALEELGHGGATHQR